MTIAHCPSQTGVISTGELGLRTPENKLIMTLTRLFVSFLLFYLASCGPERVKYTPELKQQMSDMKIKRITNADMVETVNTLGERISATVQKELTDTLRHHAGRPPQQAQLCQLKNLPRTRAIEKQYGVRIQLLSGTDVTNKTLAPKEREVLDAYLYNAEQKLSQISNIQKIADTLFIYNAVVPTDSLICQTCFGTQKTPLGVWRIAFPKREVIRRSAGDKK